MRAEQQMTICPTPNDKCSGLVMIYNGGLGHCKQKVHRYPYESFECYVNYLLSQGYQRINSRDFLSPNGTIRNLTKPSRFGGPCRPGKERTRLRPYKKRSGLFISA